MTEIQNNCTVFCVERVFRAILLQVVATVLVAAVFAVLSVTVLFNVSEIKVAKAGTHYKAEQILDAAGVEVGDDALGVNALRDAVARTIVEDIAENAEHIAMILVIELEHFLQGWTTAVDV